MSEEVPGTLSTAEVVLSCTDLDATLAFYTSRLGFRLDAISPADDPRVAVISGHGLRLRLERGEPRPAIRLRLSGLDPASAATSERTLTAPDGSVIELVASRRAVELPALAPSFCLTRASRDLSLWSNGRAGMRYRDLIPDRQGGRFIASHIRIEDGGPVADYVHFHEIRLQLIHCYKGWVRVVYEDQGEPFVMHAGDCVLQPPRIRHRVLESSPGLEVIEIASPATHETGIDHDLQLPNGEGRSVRTFDGQRFLRHRSETATWQPWRRDGFEARDTGLRAATGGIASLEVVRATAATSESASPEAAPSLESHGGELRFAFVLTGAITLHHVDHASTRLGSGDCFTMPSDVGHAIAHPTRDLELLELTVFGRGGRPGSR